jgi:hypothetical protein
VLVVTLTFDEDAVVAAADLVGRAGAREFEIGYLHDDVPVEEAGWYANAKYRGTRITEENHRGPTEAAEALARRILTGARCRCGKLVALSDDGAVAFDNVTMADGSKWSAKKARKAGQCRWTRVGKRWEPSCDMPSVKVKGARW